MTEYTMEELEKIKTEELEKQKELKKKEKEEDARQRLIGEIKRIKASNNKSKEELNQSSSENREKLKKQAKSAWKGVIDYLYNFKGEK